MKTITGTYASAKIFTDNIEPSCEQQIYNLLDQDFTMGSTIRIMPDTHAGAGCVIGFTADLGDKVVPNLVGVDIGCGMHVTTLGRIDFDLQELDKIIHRFIPAGREVHESKIAVFPYLKDLYCFKALKDDGRFEKAIGTLGGGNHFIEVDVDSTGCYYLVVHSGSRNLGKQVADFYQNMAIESCKGLGDLKEEKKKLISLMYAAGKKNKIQAELRELEREFANAHPKYPADLCFLVGQQREAYLHDMQICQEYASLNRRMITSTIESFMLVWGKDSFETVHNYIDPKDNIIRKGAVSAYKYEKLIIPINMRDGSIIAEGKGNSDWNNSAPHGAGRLMGRNEAKRNLSMDAYKNQMEGIYSTTVNASTLDEAPDAYKPIAEILANIQDTVKVLDVIKPVYNFKSAE